MSKKIEDSTVVEVKPIVKKRGGCGSFVFGFLFAFVFLIVFVGGTVMYCYYNVTLTQIENVIGVKLPLEGDIRNKALKDLIAMGIEYKDSYTEATLGTLETDFGINLPETIPGTEIKLNCIYNAEISFLGKTQSVKSYRIQDIANNLGDFIDVILPIIYKNTTINEVVKSFNITLLDDLGYPALVDKYYTTTSSVEKKSLSELTISEAMDILPEHFSDDNLTVQEIINAGGLTIMPYPETGQKDVYAGLRNLFVKNITTDQILESTDGALLNDLFDLTDFDFTQTDEFNNTKLNKMTDYIKTVPLHQFMNVPETVDANSPASDHLLFALKNVTYNDLNSEKPIKAITKKMNEAYADLVLNKIIDFTDMQNFDFLENVKLTDLIDDPTTTIDNLLSDVYIGNFVTLGKVVEGQTDFFTNSIFTNISANINLNELRDEIASLKINQILTASQLSQSTLTSAQQSMTLQQLLDSNPTATLGDLIASGQNAGFVDSLGGYIKALKDSTSTTFATDLNNTKIYDLIGDENSPSALAKLADMDLNTIAESEDMIDVLADNFGTLGELLKTQNDQGFLGIIGNVKFSDLLGNDPSGAIMAELKKSTRTLASVLGIDTFSSKLIECVMNIQVKDLFGSDPETAFKNALSAEGNTIGSIFDFTSTSGMMKYIANIEFSDLLGSDPSNAIFNAIIGSEGSYTTLGDFLDNTETTGLMSMISSVTMRDLLGKNTSTTAGQAILNAIGGSGKTLGDLMEITPTEGIAKVVADMSLSDLFGGTANPTQAFNNLKDSILLKDVFTNIETLPTKNVLRLIYETDHNVKVSEISSKVDDIKIADILGISDTNQATGVFSLIGNLTSAYDGTPQVTIGTINDMKIKNNLTIKDLCDAGIITLSDEQKTILGDDLNKTVQQFIDDYVNTKKSSGA